MREVQRALSDIGIPVFALVWRPIGMQKTAPDQYVVYTTMTTEDEHWDDSPIRYKIYVYLNLWSKADPTEKQMAIRNAMRLNGFEMVEETDSFEDDTKMYEVSSTWVLWKDVGSDGMDD